MSQRKRTRKGPLQHQIGHEHYRPQSNIPQYTINHNLSGENLTFFNGMNKAWRDAKSEKYWKSRAEVGISIILDTARAFNMATMVFPGRIHALDKFKSGDEATDAILQIGIGKVVEGVSDELCEAIKDATYYPVLDSKKYQRVMDMLINEVEPPLQPGCPSPQFARLFYADSESFAEGVVPGTASHAEYNEGNTSYSNVPSGLKFKIKEDRTPGLESAMSMLRVRKVVPGLTCIRELDHSTLLDIETGLALREPVISRAGMVRTSLASRLYRGRTDIFEKHDKTPDEGPLMAFALDMSGSMGRIWPTALATMGSVAHTFNRAKSPTLCVGFASGERQNIIFEFQGVDDTFDIDRFRIISPPTGNPDAVAVEYCRNKLLEMELTHGKRRKYLVVFSDEQPAGMCYRARLMAGDPETLRQAVSLCRKDNITTISVLDSSGYGGRDFYDKTIATDFQSPLKIIQFLTTIMDEAR